MKNAELKKSGLHGLGCVLIASVILGLRDVLENHPNGHASAWLKML